MGDPLPDLTPDELVVANRLQSHLHQGALVAIADGAGSPVGLGRPLAHAARQVGGVRLLMGWAFRFPVPLDPVAFPDVRAIIGGYGLRRRFGGAVRYLPVRLGAVPALLHSALRPDVLLCGLKPTAQGLTFGSEVGWGMAAVDAGARVLAEVNTGLPDASREGVLPGVTVIAETERPPMSLPLPVADPVNDVIGALVARWVQPGARVQFGPGGVGDAALRALDVPVYVDSGIVGDAVMDLAARGLLEGVPLATYLAGGPNVYEWADGQPILARVEYTHDSQRLSEQPIVAINTALEIDEVGQVNVEGFAGDIIGGVGGHPDFAGAASRAIRGLSIVALPTVRGGRRTLVDRLGAPTSTTRSDVDVVVTELGSADLRGLDDRERAAKLRLLWDG